MLTSALDLLIKTPATPAASIDALAKLSVEDDSAFSALLDTASEADLPVDTIKDKDVADVAVPQPMPIAVAQAVLAPNSAALSTVSAMTQAVERGDKENADLTPNEGSLPKTKSGRDLSEVQSAILNLSVEAPTATPIVALPNSDGGIDVSHLPLASPIKSSRADALIPNPASQNPLIPSPVKRPNLDQLIPNPGVPLPPEPNWTVKRPNLDQLVSATSATPDVKPKTEAAVPASAALEDPAGPSQPKDAMEIAASKISILSTETAAGNQRDAVAATEATAVSALAATLKEIAGSQKVKSTVSRATAENREAAPAAGKSDTQNAVTALIELTNARNAIVKTGKGEKLVGALDNKVSDAVISDGALTSPAQNAANSVKAADPATFAKTLNAAVHVPVAEQVIVHLRNNIKSGEREFTVRLDPESLGKVEVKLTLGADGTNSIQVTADNKNTLDLLQRDARTLERALQDAGMKTDGNALSFNLRGGQDHQMSRDSGGSGNGSFRKRQLEEQELALNLQVASYRSVNADTALDIKV